MKVLMLGVFSYLLPLTSYLFLSSCQNATVPAQFTDIKKTPRIYPDYVDVTIPVNIAPLTFELEDSCDEMVARFTVGDHQLVCGGRAVQLEMADWRELTDKAVGKAIGVEVFVRIDQEWWRYKPFHITVSADSIDPYLSYRLISPSYVINCSFLFSNFVYKIDSSPRCSTTSTKTFKLPVPGLTCSGLIPNKTF